MPKISDCDCGASPLERSLLYINLDKVKEKVAQILKFLNREFITSLAA